MKSYIIWFIPLISTLIGWITNYIAVKMIFRPRKPVTFFGITLWGLIPKRKSELAQKIGETVENELISHQDIHNVVNTPAFHEEILRSIMDAIDKFIIQKLGANPIVSIVLSGELVTQIKKMVKNELRGILPDFMENMFKKVENKLDFKEIVCKKIEEYDMSRLEQIVYNIAARELRSIEIFGGILGFGVGLVQIIIIVISNKSLF